jgi:ribosomal protein L20A (L18A)
MILDVKLGNEVRTLRFGNYALMTYNALTKTDAGEIKEQSLEYTDIDLVCDITYSALKAFYKVKRQPFDITIEQVSEWIDEASIEDIQKIILTFSESVKTTEFIEMAQKAMAIDNTEVDSKKK